MDIDLTNVGAVLVVLAPLTVLLVGIFAVPDAGNLDHLFPPPRELEWPRGVQEEEPVRWRTESLTQRQRGAPTNAAAGTTEAERRTLADRRSKRAA